MRHGHLSHHRSKYVEQNVYKEIRVARVRLFLQLADSNFKKNIVFLFHICGLCDRAS
jgi:hypothetical protein